MKITYSLREFYDEVKQLAETKGIDYVAVRTEFKKHEGLTFHCYAHGANWYNGSTPSEAIAQLHNFFYPVIKEDTKNDVEIESSPEPANA